MSDTVEPITITQNIGGWTVAITAPDGVEMFGVQSLGIEIVDSSGFHVTLEASVER